jgi:hypothetical protein
VFIASLFVVSDLRAQRISGRVADSASGRGLPGARVSLIRDSVPVITRAADDSGRFDLAAPQPGRYTMRIVAIGYAPYFVPVDGANDRQLGVIRLGRLPTILDSVVSRANQTSVFQVTPGRVVLQRHAAMNLGQMVSGIEIRRSRLTVTEYLGTLPGLRLMQLVPLGPTIPGVHGYVVSRTSEGCLYGRIDHWSIPGLFDLLNVKVLEDLVSVDDIMGVEVYEAGSVPPEWRLAVTSILPVVRDGDAGRRAALVGHTGYPTRPKVSAEASIGAMKNATPPLCAFIQIWTRISW